MFDSGIMLAEAKIEVGLDPWVLWAKAHLDDTPIPLIDDLNEEVQQILRDIWRTPHERARAGMHAIAREVIGAYR